MTEAAEWIRTRLPSAPDRLTKLMISAVQEHVRESVAEELAEGAFSLYRVVLSGSGGREDALYLLAADALFTHAFEAQAELSPGGIGPFADRWSSRRRLAELLQ